MLLPAQYLGSTHPMPPFECGIEESDTVPSPSPPLPNFSQRYINVVPNKERRTLSLSPEWTAIRVPQPYKGGWIYPKKLGGKLSYNLSHNIALWSVLGVQWGYDGGCARVWTYEEGERSRRRLFLALGLGDLCRRRLPLEEARL